MTKDNQKALSLSSTKKLEPMFGGKHSLITEADEYKQNYIVHRINMPSIEVTEKIRDFIEMAMIDGKKFVRVGEHTLMVNSISGIDPLPRKREPRDKDEFMTPDGKYWYNKRTKTKRLIER